MTTYEWAKHYIELGWSVIPVNPNKIPAIKQVIPFRTRRASDEELHNWFDSEKYGIGIITGKLSGILVIDDDSMKKAGVSASLLSSMKSTVMSRTPTGGTHYFLQHEEGYGNQVNIAGCHIDIRTEGGYVAVPPSKRMIDGKEARYEWISEPTPESILAMPKLSATKQVEQAFRKIESKPLDIQTLLNLKEGERNSGLLKLACSLISKNTKEWVWDFVQNAGRQYNPPLPEKEILTIYTQAVKYHDADILKGKQQNLSITGDVREPVSPRKIKDVVTERKKERALEDTAPSTGWYELDNLIGGIIPGSLYCLTGETNAGKTTVAANIAVNVAKQKKKVLYIALETGNKIVEVLASARLGKPYSDLTEDDMQDESGYIELFVDRDIVSVSDLKTTLEKLSTRYDLIIIDHIGYFVSDRQNYLQEQANILKELRFITKQNKTAVILIAHLRKRSASTRKESIPSSDDIAGTAAFKQDSTDVLIVIRQKDEQDPYKLRVTNHGFLYVTKTKAKSVGAVQLLFHDMDYMAKSAKVEEMVK